MYRFLAILAAILLHGGFILFGRLLFGAEEEDEGTLQQVELLAEEVTEEKKDEDKKQDQAEESAEEIETETEEAPDAAEIIKSLELAPTNDAPALEAASLSAIEDALRGGGGGGDFAEALTFSSGGRIGGTGRPGEIASDLESAFSLDELDQKPRAVFQASPLYPAEMRGKKIEGSVSIIFIVDPNGRPVELKVLKSTHPAFEKPAMDAVKRWKFEPAIKAGKRVPCKMRVPIRFEPNGGS